MNREQRKRITQNITNLKERLVDLDPIIDRLIEKDVFSLEHREKIEHVSPATPQKKFNEFIQLLLASPEPNTYFVFLEALTEERHHYMAERLQNTVISGKSRWTRSRKYALRPAPGKHNSPNPRKNFLDQHMLFVCTCKNSYKVYKYTSVYTMSCT